MDHSSPETPGRPTLDEETLDRIIAYRATDRPFYSLDAGELDLLLRLVDVAPMRWALGPELSVDEAAKWQAARAGFTTGLFDSAPTDSTRPDLIRGTCRHCGAEIHRYANAVNWNHDGRRTGDVTAGTVNYHAAEPASPIGVDPHPVFATCEGCGNEIVRLPAEKYKPRAWRHTGSDGGTVHLAMPHA